MQLGEYLADDPILDEKPGSMQQAMQEIFGV